MLETTRFAQYLSTFLFEYNIRIHFRAQSIFLSLQDMSRYPLKFNQVPPLFVEPYILNGFRSIHQPWSYYWKSLFHKHNETINVWSHLIGILYMGHLLIYYYSRLNFFENAHSWPFVVSLCTAILMFICSAFAHLLHSKSEPIHMTCFLIDFIGVSLHGFGSGFLQIYYCAPQWYYEKIQSHYVFILLILGILACFLNCFAQYYYQRPYPPMKRICQFFPCGVLWVFSITPLCIRLYSSNILLNPSLVCHLAQIILFVIGAILFAFDIPQRFWPGTFDFIGQGHHLFHLCIYLVTVCQMHGVYWDYEEFQNVINQRSKPDLIFCAGSIFSLIAWDLVIVCFFRRKIYKKYQ
jgi:predicted membrane channel-forming protein YqfA (hemolysin III family)